MEESYHLEKTHLEISGIKLFLRLYIHIFYMYRYLVVEISQIGSCNMK